MYIDESVFIKSLLRGNQIFKWYKLGYILTGWLEFFSKILLVDDERENDRE